MARRDGSVQAAVQQSQELLDAIQATVEDRLAGEQRLREEAEEHLQQELRRQGFEVRRVENGRSGSGTRSVCLYRKDPSNLTSDW